MIRKTTQFRRMLTSKGVEFLMEAHDGISAAIVEEAGFQGIWGSGLCISASLGVRDNNEASWTQVLDVVEYMSDASTIPILLDADTGYGNFNNVRRLVRKLEQRQCAAMCIEDKLFPKTNSFIGGEKQPLADIDEFAGKIKAAKDTQRDDDFSVVARVEAFIAGWGLSEAMKRAEAYHAAGADAILMHSKQTTADQVVSFMREWGNACPVVIVPTTYYKTPTSVFEEAGASVIIWANHLLRATITTMQKTAARIQREQSVAPVVDGIASVKEVFRLQNAGELKKAEGRYLPAKGSSIKAIVLATATGYVPGLGSNGSRSDGNGQRSNGNGRGSNGNGRRSADSQAGVAKAMVPYKGRPLLQWQVSHFNDAGIKEILVAAAALPEHVDLPGAKLIVDPAYANSGELSCLATLKDHLEGCVLLGPGEILLPQHVLSRLQHEPGDVVIAVDADAGNECPAVRFDHLVRCTACSTRDFMAEQPRLLELSPDEPHGEWIGLAKLSPAGAAHVLRAIQELEARPDFGEMTLRDLLAHLITGGVTVHVMYINGQWLHIDQLEDLVPTAGAVHA